MLSHGGMRAFASLALSALISGSAGAVALAEEPLIAPPRNSTEPVFEKPHVEAGVTDSSTVDIVLAGGDEGDDLALDAAPADEPDSSDDGQLGGAGAGETGDGCEAVGPIEQGEVQGTVDEEGAVLSGGDVSADLSDATDDTADDISQSQPTDPEAALPSVDESTSQDAFSDGAISGPVEEAGGADSLDGKASSNDGGEKDSPVPGSSLTAQGNATPEAKAGAAQGAPARTAGWHTEGGKTYYNGADGERFVGEHRIDGAWYYFDPDNNGAMATGFVRQPISSGPGSFKVAYYGDDGKRLSGIQRVDGDTFFFDDASGALSTGFIRQDANAFNFYDLSSGARLYGQQAIHDQLRHFDETTGALSTGLTTLAGEDAKTVYYDTFDGSMQYGQQYVDGRWHFFDEDTGRMYTAEEERDRVLAVAYDSVGQSEGQAWGYQNDVVAAGGRYCIEGPCMSFVWHCFKAAGMDRFLADGFVSGWPHEVYDYMWWHGQASSTPRVGDVVFFKYPGTFAERDDLSASHAEIVVEVNDTYILSIGALEGGIQVHYFPYDYIVGYGVPSY